ncbi:MAG: hypothetical protein RLY93_12425 [Sumerlaeia bacterium]
MTELHATATDMGLSTAPAVGGGLLVLSILVKAFAPQIRDVLAALAARLSRKDASRAEVLMDEAEAILAAARQTRVETEEYQNRLRAEILEELTRTREELARTRSELEEERAAHAETRGRLSQSTEERAAIQLRLNAAEHRITQLEAQLKETREALSRTNEILNRQAEYRRDPEADE